MTIKYVYAVSYIAQGQSGGFTTGISEISTLGAPIDNMRIVQRIIDIISARVGGLSIPICFTLLRTDETTQDDIIQSERNAERFEWNKSSSDPDDHITLDDMLGVLRGDQ